MIKVGQNKSFKYILDTNCDYYNPSNCDCEDIHRCGQIHNAKVTGIDPRDARSMVEKFVDGDDLQKLLAFMFFRHCFKNEDFDIDITHGYYGEEVNDIRMMSSGYDKISHFNTLIETNDIRAMLAMILTHHYGYVLPDILDYKEWELIEVSTKDIYAPEAGMKQVSDVGYDHWGKHPLLVPSYYPGCLVIPSGDKLKIIDGFHRWTSFNSKKKRRKVKVLAPKQ